MRSGGPAMGLLIVAAGLYSAAPLVLREPASLPDLVQGTDGAWRPLEQREADFRHGDRVEQIAGSLRATGPAEPLVFGRPLDLNHASAEQLQALPGVGPALSARVVASREAEGPFGSVAELERVRGVGPATRARLEPWLTVDP